MSWEMEAEATAQGFGDLGFNVESSGFRAEGLGFHTLLWPAGGNGWLVGTTFGGYQS